MRRVMRRLVFWVIVIALLIWVGAVLVQITQLENVRGYWPWRRS